MHDRSDDPRSADGDGEDLDSLLSWFPSTERDAAPRREPLEHDLVAARLAAGAEEGRRRAREHGDADPGDARSAPTASRPVAQAEPGAHAPAARPVEQPRPLSQRLTSRPWSWETRRLVQRVVVGGAVAVLVVVSAGLLVAAAVKADADATAAARDASGFRPAASAGAPARPLVVVLGDESAGQAGAGIGAEDRWPRLLADGSATTVRTVSASGTRYVGADRRTYGRLAARVPKAADVVLLVGGVHDAGTDRLTVVRSAVDAVGAVRRRAPQAEVVVVGPVVGDGAPSTELDGVRKVLRSAAAITGSAWIDPIGARWLDEPATAGTAALGRNDQRTIATRLGFAVEDALQRAASTTGR